MKFIDWFREKPIQLELKAATSRVPLPQAPQLEFSSASYGRYASRSELVYACIEKKAQAFCDPELVVQRKNGKGEWEDIIDHPALQVLNIPNPSDDNESFFRCWTASENVAGVFYAEIVRSGAGSPVELYPLRPDCVFPQYVHSSKGMVLDHYAYRMNGYEVRYKPEELLIHRMHSLSSMYAGMSPMAVALASIDADISATEYVRDFFNNDGTPSGILKVTGRNLSDDEALRMKQKWQSLYARNGKGRGGVAILDDSADYETVGAKLNELNSEELTSIDETRICMAFGVPPVIIGAYVGLKNVNQKASFKGALEEFWMNTMSPELKIKRKFLTNKFLPFFEGEEAIRAGKIRFFWNMDTVSAMQEDIDAIHDRVSLGYKSGLYKLDEAREKIGLEPVGEEFGGEEFFKAPVVNPEGTEDEETLVEKRERREKSILDADLIEKKTLEFRRELSEAEQSIDIKAIADSFENIELAKTVLTIKDELFNQALTTALKLSESEIHTLSVTPPTTVYRRVRKLVEASVQEGRSQVAKKKGVEVKGIIDDLIDRLVDLTVSRIVTEVSAAVINIITQLAILGLDVEEDEVRSRFEERSDKPYESIARQATKTAVNAGRREEMKGGSRFEYSAILDKNVCGPCEQWDGKQAENIDDLPETPNPECEGGAECRCFIIEIGSEAKD